MTPYYEDDACTIYHGDALEVLPSLPPMDVCFGDPPYNSGLTYGEATDDNRADYWDWLDARIDTMNAAAGTVLVKHSALKLSAFVVRHPGVRVLVWSKPFSSGFPLNGVATHWEPIFWFSGKSAKWSKDVFTCNAGNSGGDTTTGHPAQFPVSVGRWLVDTFCPDDGVWCDAFMGSGTTLRAAKDLGRKAIGIEIEERYCEIAAKRLAQEVLPL